MRSALRMIVLLLVLVALLAPLATYASDGPCPDDPDASMSCDAEPPDYYVVVNRSFERLGPEYGTGCQPWILKHPDCVECQGDSEECLAAAIDVEQIICGLEMEAAGAQDGDTLWEMCCNCPSTDPGGTWMFRERTFRQLKDEGGNVYWDCSDPGPWQPGLPPDTGIDLPTPFVVAGLALLGAGFLVAGMLVRRRVPTAA
jgi:hypothetical protein